MTCMINGQTNGPCPEYSFNSANNQITNTGYTYDAAGDLTNDTSYSYQWDAEGRMTSVDNGSTETRVYNALGEIGQLTAGGDTAQMVYAPDGQMLGVDCATEGQWCQQYLPFGSRDLGYYFPALDSQTRFLHPNLLGSTAMRTLQSGGEDADIRDLPWGQNWLYSGWNGVDEDFGGFGHIDQFTGTYPTLHRNYNPSEGRWLTPDRLGGDITNPQSLNRYAYALNNPTTLTDPLGLDATDCAPNGSGGVTCSGPDSVTVNGGTPPNTPTLGGGIGECPFFNCVPNCSIFACGAAPWNNGGGGTIYVTSYGTSGGGASPKPAPPGLQVSTTKLIQSFNQCAANFADKYSMASLLHVNNVPGLGAVLGSSSAAASHLLFGTRPSEYVPAGTNLAAGVKAGWLLAKGAGEARNIPISQGFQSIFTTIAPTTFGQTVAGEFLTGTAARTGELLDALLPFQVGYDDAFYGAGEVACTAEALGW